MIVSHDDMEYSGVVTDVIRTLKGLDHFILQIWVDNTEIPFTVYDNDDLEFLHESIRITSNSENTVTWVLYGIIMTFKVTGYVAP